MAVVVRCTGCRGASQVRPEAVGLLVVCPLCHEAFLAIEEAAPVVKPAAPKPRAATVQPVRRPRRSVAEPVHEHVSSSPHEAPRPPDSGLPVSVLFGFALLPLAIPLLWLIGPHLLSKPPALTLAAPISLAIAASVLCLAVVLTVDWTPLTRIKGVLILVGLSYFAGLSLYFLKKDLVERVRDFLTPTQRWQQFQAPARNFEVTVPGEPQPTNLQPLRGWSLTCYQSAASPFSTQPLQFYFGSGPDAKPNVDNWFDEVGKAMEAAAGQDATFEPATEAKALDDRFVGRQWKIDLPSDRTRVVRVFRANKTVFYLSVEGESPDMEGNADLDRFFNSFRITPPGK